MAKVGRIVKESMIKIAEGRIEQADGSFYVTSVNRLSSGKSNELRQKLKGQNARLQIVKRRIGKRVLDSLNIDGLGALADAPEGSVGLVIPQDDAIPVAKDLVDFIKNNEDTLVIRGGVLDGKLISDKDVKAVAELPSREQLLAQVILTVEAPIAQFISLTEQLIGDVIWAAEQAAQKKPAEPAAE